jgi:hypothetical protein
MWGCAEWGVDGLSGVGGAEFGLFVIGINQGHTPVFYIPTVDTPPTGGINGFLKHVKCCK